MGVSTDGILFFGYAWDNEGWPGVIDENEEESSEPDASPEEAYLTRKGLWHPLPHKNGPSPEYTAWSENLAVLRQLEKNLPFETFTHCHSECPMWAMAIRGTKITAWRGSTKEVDPLALAMTSTAQLMAQHDAALREACQVLGMRPGKLGWWLVSNWS
jgi:hypothetical protein